MLASKALPKPRPHQPRGRGFFYGLPCGRIALWEALVVARQLVAYGLIAILLLAAILVAMQYRRKLREDRRRERGGRPRRR